MGKEYAQTKESIVTFVANRTGVNKETTKKVINEALNVIAETISAKQSVAISGFGVFKTAERAARTGRNPKTGEEIQIPARTAVVFKAYNGLKDAVNR